MASTNFRPTRLQITPDREITPSKQLLDQIRLAIASGNYPPGHRLPSTRQLGSMTGLHRNTISKIYQQLEEQGLVKSQAGSGIYVNARGPSFRSTSEPEQLVQKSLNDLLALGYSLNQAKELFLSAIDWRLRCNAKVLVAVPQRDLGVGELIVTEVTSSRR